jgi:hypothetical protein
MIRLRCASAFIRFRRDKTVWSANVDWMRWAFVQAGRNIKDKSDVTDR